MDYKLEPLMIALITNHCKNLGTIRSKKAYNNISSSTIYMQSTLSKSAFHLSELTGQTIPVVMSSLLIKTLQPDQSNPEIKYAPIKEMVFQQKLLENFKPISFSN